MLNKLGTFEEWYAATKDHGGTRAEYEKLKRSLERKPRKSAECEGCPLLDCEGPVPSELNGRAAWDLEGDTDVLFVSEAPGRWEVAKNRPFSNPHGAGGVLRQSLKQVGIDKFGILNVWRCFASDTPILMSDMTYKPISEIRVDDEVVGVSQSTNTKLLGKFIRTRVTYAFRRLAEETVDVVHSRGKVTCTHEHPFFAGEGIQRSGYWTEIRKLNGKDIKFVGLPPDNREEFNCGWLAGYFDGDGHFGEEVYSAKVKACSKDEDLIDHAIEVAHCFDFEFHKFSELDRVGNTIYTMTLVKGSQEKSKKVLSDEFRSLLFEGAVTDDYKRGWLAGFYDAEGSSVPIRAWSVDLRIWQQVGEKLKRLKSYLSDCGFHYTESYLNSQPNMCQIRVADAVHFYVECPSFLTRKRVVKCNLATVGSTRIYLEPNGRMEVYNLSTECENFVAGGFVVHNCRPPNNKLPGGEPGKFCRDRFAEDLLRFNQKATVALGAVGLDALTEHSMSIMKVRGRLFTTNFNGHKLFVMPMLHPAFLLRQRAWWRDWELDLEKLKRYITTGELNYIPLSKRKVHQAHTRGEALAFVKRLQQFDTIACDIETTSFNMPWENGEIISVAFAWSPNEACATPYRFVTLEVFDELKLLLEDKNKRWIWYNGPYDVQFFWAEGMNARIDGDAMLEAHLLDERLNVHSLKKDSAVHLNQIDWEEGIKKYKIPNDTSQEAQDAWRNIPESELLEYNGQDTTHTLHLSTVLREQLATDLRRDVGIYLHLPNWDYADDLVIPTYNMLARARMIGIRVDLYKVKELSDLFTPILSDIEKKLAKISGDVFFNANSSQQKLALLNKHGLKVANTRREMLETYRGDEVVDLMLDYSEAHKMNSTYVIGIADDISDDLRVHPDWRLPTETGRPRCSDPNILGMPRKAEESEHKWKRRIKEMFIADKDTLLMHIDRRQSEFRCCLFLADELDFIKFLIDNPDADIHGEFAKKIYGSIYTKEQRVYAKMVVFGLQNNREAPSIARQFTAIEREKARNEGRTDYHKWTIREAQEFIDEFFARIPKVVDWKQETMKEALSTGELTSWMGRKRRFGLITWENKKEVENEAVNFPISSLSADLNFLSCIETMKQFGRYGVEVLAPIHDAGLLRIPKESNNLPDDIGGMWEELVPKILHTDLPFPVDVTVGERWSDL